MELCRLGSLRLMWGEFLRDALSGGFPARHLVAEAPVMLALGVEGAAAVANELVVQADARSADGTPS